ncbi:MAG TPA: penicillin-binding protein activator [Rudaea sp.]
MLATVLLGGCVEMGTVQETPAAADAAVAEQFYQQGEMDRAAAEFMNLAAAHAGDRNHYRLRAAEAWREAGNLDAAAGALEGVKPKRLATEEVIRYGLLLAEIDLAHHQPARALQELDFAETATQLPLRQRALELRARAQAENGDAIGSARTRAALNRMLGGADRAQNETQIVDTLAQLGPDVIRQQAESLPPGDPLLPWLNQALRKSGQALPQIVLRPNQAVGTLMPDQNNTMAREGYRSAHKVALLLPLDGPLKAVAQSVRDGFFAAYFADSNPQRPELRTYDSGNTAQDAVRAYQQAVKDGADRVVGPLRREGVSAVFAQGRLPVPVLALNQPERGEVPPPGSAAFGLAPDPEAAQAAEHMFERGYRRAVIITATDDWAERAALAFRAQFESQQGQIVSEARIQDNEINYSAVLRQAMASIPAIKSAVPPSVVGSSSQAQPALESEVGIFISMRPQQARLLLPQIKLAGYTQLPVFATSHIYSGTPNPGMDRDLDGVEFCDAPWLFDAALGLPKYSDISRSLDSARGAGARLFAMGLDAYALLPYLEWLSQHHDSYVPGATGQLAEDNLDRIQRLLIWARFDNGVAHPVNGGLSVSGATP